MNALKAKHRDEFDICLALVLCFERVNEVFERNNLDIKLKVESSLIPSDNNQENLDIELPVKS